MITKNLFLFILLFLNFSVCSQTVEKEGLLWKITGKDLKQPSYLFGTYHGSPGIGADFLDSIPGFYDAFNSVTQYVGESDFSSGITEGTKEYFAKYYGNPKMPNDTTYKDLLSESDYDYLDLTVRVSARIFMTEADSIRPNYLWLMISQAKRNDFMQQVFGTSKKEIMDFYLLKAARNKGYTIEGLDSPDMLLKSLEIIYGNTPLPQSLQESADTLISNIKRYDDETVLSEHFIQEFIRNIRDFEAAYKRQDLSGLEKYKNEQIEMVNTYDVTVNTDFLLDGRTSSWMEKIPTLISNQPTMIGVGACHLYGKNGLINLLRQKGYHLEVVKQ